MPGKFLRRLSQDQSGASGLLLAASMTAVMAGTAFAVDLGSIHLAKRKLQGLADASALAVSEAGFTGDASSPVNALIARDGSKNVRVVGMVPGTYTADVSIPADSRFTPGPASGANAMQVTLEQQVPLFFGVLLTGNRNAQVQAKAIASRQDMAAYSIGTQLTNLTGNLPNQLLSALSAQPLNLTPSDISLLASSQIDLLAAGDAIAVREGLTGKTYGEIFGRSVSAAELIDAYATAAGNTPLGDLLRSIADRAGSNAVDLGALIDLGPLANTDIRDPSNPLAINAYTLVRGALQLSQGETYDITVSVTGAGLASATLRVAGVNATVHSPMLTVTAARDYVLRTGTGRVYLDAQVASSLAGIASLHVPFYSELAPGEARLTDIACTGNPATDGVTLGVKPSIGSAAIGTVDTTLFDDFSAPLTVSPVAMADTLLVKITGYSNLSLSGNAEQSVFFTMPEIANHVVKSAWSTDVVGSLAVSLVKQAQISVRTLGLGLNASAITSTVGTTLQIVAPTVDSLIDTASRSTGIGLGVSDVTVDRVRCGAPLLVG
jgi:uncharacterized membrane protein